MARNWDSLTLLAKTYIFIGGKYKFCGKNSPLFKKTLFVSDFLLNIMKDLSGYVYIISNNAFKGYYKIGITKDIKKRLRTYQTSSPHRNYKVEHYIFHEDCKAAEKQIHEAMHYFALSKRNEWFEIDLSIAKVRLDETLK